jgi:hypothetical protein
VKDIKVKEDPDEEIAIYYNAVIYRRGEYWQFRMWLSAENKYARKSLRTQNKMQQNLTEQTTHMN